jgi:hypothetical protein
MSIAHEICRVSPLVAGIPLTSFTVDELEAMLEACAYSLRRGQSLYNGLLDCGTDRQFDAETLGELEHQHQSRSELVILAGACATRLRQLEIKEVA